LRKDRYSALLYANFYARNKDKQTVITIQYKAVGGTRETVNSKKTIVNKGMYSGPGLLKFGQNQGWNMYHGGTVRRNNKF
jgi:hypothetical protein